MYHGHEHFLGKKYIKYTPYLVHGIANTVTGTLNLPPVTLKRTYHNHFIYLLYFTQQFIVYILLLPLELYGTPHFIKFSVVHCRPPPKRANLHFSLMEISF